MEKTIFREAIFLHFTFGTGGFIFYQYTLYQRLSSDSLATRARLLEARLVPTSDKYHGNL